MKKLLIILISFIPVVLFGQTTYNIRGPLNQTYKTGASNDTSLFLLIGDSATWKTTKSKVKTNKPFYAPNVFINGDSAASRAYARSLIGVETDPVWTLAEPYRVTRQELGDTASDLRNRIDSIVLAEPPAGGYASNVYFDSLTSVVYSAYKTLTYNVRSTTYIMPCTVTSSDGDKTIESYIYPSYYEETLIPSGLWTANLYGYVDATTGVTQIGVQFFKRSNAGVDSTLFTVWSNEINNTTADWIIFSSSQPNFNVNPTDRLCTRILARTTSSGTRTISVYIGDGYGAYTSAPNRIRHSQLRALNSDTSYLHVTKQDTTNWNYAFRNVGSSTQADSIYNLSDYIIYKKGSNYYSYNSDLKLAKTSTNLRVILRAALDSVRVGGKIVLLSGDYTLTDSIKIWKNVKLEGVGNVNINWPVLSKYMIYAEGTVINTTTLKTASVINKNVFEVSSVTGWREGDLLQIYDDKLWARMVYPTLKTGELLKIWKASDDTIVTYTNAKDYYRPDSNAVVTIYRPITLKIKNINFKGAGEASTSQFIQMKWNLNSVIENCDSINNFGRFGIIIYSCYNTTIDKCNFRGMIQSGFGYAADITAMTTLTQIKNCHFERTRHAVTHGEVSPLGVSDESYIINNIFDNAVSSYHALDAHCSHRSLHAYDNTFNCGNTTNYGLTNTNNLAIVSDARYNYIYRNKINSGYGIKNSSHDYVEQNWDIQKNQFKNCTKSFEYYAASNNRINEFNMSNNTFDEDMGQMCYVGNVNSVKINNNTYRDKTPSTGSLYAISVSSARGGQIQNNSIDSCAISAIYLSRDSSISVNGNEINYHNMSNSTEHTTAIIAANSSSCNIFDNTIVRPVVGGNNSYGIEETGTCYNNAIEGNKLDRCGTNTSYRIIKTGNKSYVSNNKGYPYSRFGDNGDTVSIMSDATFNIYSNGTKRVNLNPKISDGASAVAYFIDTHNSLSNPAARLLSVRNVGVERLWVDVGGSVNCQNVNGAQIKSTIATNDASYYFGNDGSVNRLNLNGNVSDGAGAVAYLFDTKNALSTLGAKLFSLKNSGTEKAFIDKDGAIKSVNGADSSVLSNITGLRLYGNSTVYDDLFFPFSTGKQGTADYPAFSADSMYYSFSVDTTAPEVCIMYFNIQLPHSWKEGSTIYPHIHYKHETAVGTPTFKMKYKWYSGGGTTQKDWKWYTIGTASATTDKTIQRVSGSGGISGSGMGISSILVCAVYLSGQTGTGDVHAYQFDIHIEKDAIGSNSESTK